MPYANTRTRIVGLLLAVAALLILGGMTFRQSPSTVTWVPATVKFPAIGNIAAVGEWKPGRLVRTTQHRPDELILEIRTPDQTLHRLTCPRQPFDELAVASNWLDDRARNTPTAVDIVERMVAFDADQEGRVIAFASLEPMARNGRRVAQAYGR